MTQHPVDDLAAFAIGALDEDEARVVRRHVEACESCRAELRALGETAFAIAETAERDVPPRLRDAVVARARGERGGQAASWLDLFRRPVPLAVPLALAVLLAVSLAGYGLARRDSDRYATALAGVAGARVVSLAATGELAGVRGSLIIPSEGAAPYLILDLPAPPSGKTWEAWVIRADRPLAAGLSDERGVRTLVLTASLASGDVVAVTLERSGGVDAPTSAPVLAGKT